MSVSTIDGRAFGTSLTISNVHSRSQDTQAMMADIQGRIQKQRQMMKGYQAVRSASANPEVQRQAESNIRDAQRSISYLEESLQALMNKRSSNVGPGSAAHSSGQDSSSMAGSSSFGGGHPGSSQTSFGSGTSGSLPPGAQRGYPGDAASAYNQQRGSSDRPLPPAPGSPGFQGGYPGAGGTYGGAGGEPRSWQPASINRMGTSARKNFTNLGESTHAETQWHTTFPSDNPLLAHPQI